MARRGKQLIRRNPLALAQHEAAEKAVKPRTWLGMLGAVLRDGKSTPVRFGASWKPTRAQILERAGKMTPEDYAQARAFWKRLQRDKRRVRARRRARTGRPWAAA